MSESSENKVGVGVSLIVRKKKDFLVRLGIFGIYAVLAAFILIVFRLAGPIGIFVGGFLLVPTVIMHRYFVIKHVKVEFEYVFSSGIFEITKIENQANRVPVVRVPVDDIIDFGRVMDPDAPKHRKESKKCVFAGISDESETSYYFTCKDEHSNVNMYVFDPDDRILNALKRYSPKIEKAARK